MNKKILSLILALVVILSVIFAISGCNKNVAENSTDITSETENTTDKNTESETTEDKAQDSNNISTENKTDIEETETHSSEKPVEPTTDAKEPETTTKFPDRCDVCGNIIISDTYKGNTLVGDYCDGNCDQWNGSLEV